MQMQVHCLYLYLLLQQEVQGCLPFPTEALNKSLVLV